MCIFILNYTLGRCQWLVLLCRVCNCNWSRDTLQNHVYTVFVVEAEWKITIERCEFIAYHKSVWSNTLDESFFLVISSKSNVLSRNNNFGRNFDEISKNRSLSDSEVLHRSNNNYNSLWKHRRARLSQIFIAVQFFFFPSSITKKDKGRTASAGVEFAARHWKYAPGQRSIQFACRGRVSWF